MRRAARIDCSQADIVRALRQIPGVTVELGMDDILVGHKGKSYWFEIKSPHAISPKTGQVRPSEITHSERNRQRYWAGHYSIVWTLEQILAEIGIADATAQA